jgi:glyoxylase-like metal-dependent hydrolase (beta-lactamase superfamily II)
MSHFFLSTFIVVLAFTSTVLAQDFRIVAIDEMPGRTMSADLFTTADQDAVRRYMPDGSAPASVTTFVMFAGEDIVLFDAGLGNELWEQKLTEIVGESENVKLILLTHTHGDHIGGLMKGDVRRFPNAEISLSRQELEHWMPLVFLSVDTTAQRRQQGAPYHIWDAYSSIGTFRFGEVVFENAYVKVTAKDASGHSPGHTVFLIEPKQEGQERLLILGDLLHAAALQFPVPEACARFDRDMPQAVIARKRILDFAAEEGILIGGMHFPPPSIGMVRKNDDGGYVFELKE